MLHHTDTPAGVAVTSSPGLVYVIYAFVAGLTIEKWVSAATLVFVLLQIFFLLKDRLKKRRTRKAEE